MKKAILAVLVSLACFGCASGGKAVIEMDSEAISSDSYYVSARGNDKSHGRTEAGAFKTLAKAAAAATNGDIKKITVIGVLNVRSERITKVNKNRGLFFLENTGDDEIFITGKSGATETERAVLSGAGSKRTVVDIRGISNLRFANIEISGGDGSYGGGLYIRGEKTTVTIEEGTKIIGNRAYYSGGGVSFDGERFIMNGGEISGNITESDYSGANGGGGVSIASEFIMHGGKIVQNSTKRSGGAVCMNGRGRFFMYGGEISENRADGNGGGVYLGDQALFLKQDEGSITNNWNNPANGGEAVESNIAFAPPSMIGQWEELPFGRGLQYIFLDDGSYVVGKAGTAIGIGSYWSAEGKIMMTAYASNDPKTGKLYEIPVDERTETVIVKFPHPPKN